jgi:hypothetical protein
MRQVTDAHLAYSRRARGEVYRQARTPLQVSRQFVEGQPLGNARTQQRLVAIGGAEYDAARAGRKQRGGYLARPAGGPAGAREQELLANGSSQQAGAREPFEIEIALDHLALRFGDERGLRDQGFDHAVEHQGHRPFGQIDGACFGDQCEQVAVDSDGNLVRTRRDDVGLAGVRRGGAQHGDADGCACEAHVTSPGEA